MERCFKVVRGDTAGQYVVLKTVALSLGLPVVTAITHRPVQRCCAVNDVSGFSSVIQHHQPGAASLCSCVSLPHTVDRSGRNGHHLPLTHGNSAEIAHKTPRCFISRLLFIVQL